MGVLVAGIRPRARGLVWIAGSQGGARETIEFHLSGSPDVKAFGQMMVKDHSQANKELARVASQLNVQLPTDLDEKHNRLKSTSKA
jgi:hypothetical protein